MQVTPAEVNADQLLDGLRMGRLEGAIIGVGGATRPASRSRSSTTKPLVGAVSHDHELAVHPVVSLDTLATRALISVPRHGSAL